MTTLTLGEQAAWAAIRAERYAKADRVAVRWTNHQKAVASADAARHYAIAADWLTHAKAHEAEGTAKGLTDAVTCLGIADFHIREGKSRMGMIVEHW